MKRRRFPPHIYARIIKRQQGICACGCGEELGLDPREIQFDHALPLHLDGADEPENLRALIRKHHLAKTTREAKARAKVERIKAREGLMKRRLNQKDKALAKMLEGR